MHQPPTSSVVMLEVLFACAGPMVWCWVSTVSLMDLGVLVSIRAFWIHICCFPDSNVFVVSQSRKVLRLHRRLIHDRLWSTWYKDNWLDYVYTTIAPLLPYTL